MSAATISSSPAQAAYSPTTLSQGRATSTWRAFRRHRPGVIGLVVLTLLVVSSIVMPMFSPFDMNAVNPAAPFAPSGTVDPISGHVYLLGTDYLGRDAFSRLFYAGRISLLVALLATVAVVVVGAAIGALAGYHGGLPDALLMRFTDFMLALPLLPMYLFAVRMVRTSPALAKSSETHDVTLTVVSMAGVFLLFGWMGLARLVRGSFLSLRTREYVEASRALGAGGGRIMFKHLLPNAAAPVLVAATFVAADFIILETVLSYFGQGVYEYAAPSWGNLLAGAQNLVWYVGNLNPFQEVRGYLIFLPTLMILASVLSINYIGDALRDVLDPHGREPW
jgi:peptide/nickel transport system permease protein